jgi:F-type H+-transporting ATPase subunit b
MDALIEAFGINGKLLLAQSVNFGLLVFGLTFFLYKPVLKLLRERADLIRKGVEDAESAGKKLADLEREKTAVLTQAERDAEEAVAKGVAEGKRERASIVERAQTQSDSILSDARLQADELKRRAEKESEKEIAKAAILAAEQILKTK